MSTVYGQPGGYAPRKVNFGWIGEAWDYFKQTPGVWVVAMLVYYGISFLFQLLFTFLSPNPATRFPYQPNFNTPGYGMGRGFGDTFSPSMLFSFLIIWLLITFFLASFYRMGVKQVRGEALTFSDIFGGGPYYVQMLIFGLLLGVCYFIGALALCVGAFVAYGLLFPGFALVADGETASNAITRSFDAMKSDWLSATLFYIVLMLLISLGALACGVGILVTMPIHFIVPALAYRDMIGMPGAGTPAPSAYGNPSSGVWPPPPSAGQAPQNYPPAGPSYPPAGPNYPTGGQAPPNYPAGGQVPPSYPPPGNPGAPPPPEPGQYLGGDPSENV